MQHVFSTPVVSGVKDEDVAVVRQDQIAHDIHDKQGVPRYHACMRTPPSWGTTSDCQLMVARSYWICEPEEFQNLLELFASTNDVAIAAVLFTISMGTTLASPLTTS